MSIIKKLIILIRSMLLAWLVAHLSACGGMSEQEGIAKARGYYQSRDLNAAGIELKNVLISNAQNAEARFLLGKISLEIGDAAGAEKNFRRALEAGWDEASSQLLLAEVLFRQGEFRSVLDDIPIKDSYPDDVKANLLGLWASAEQALGKWKDSEGTIITAGTIDKDALWVLQSRIRLQLKNGKEESADQLIDNATKLYPDSRDLWLLKANRALIKKDFAATDDYFQKVIDLDPPKIVSGWQRLARLGQCRVRLMQNETEKALETLKPALKHFSFDPELNYYRSVIAFQQGEYDVAKEYLLKVFRDDPNHYAGLLLSANLYYLQQDNSQAAYYLEKATAARPGNLDAQQALGKIYLTLGQYNEAQERFEFTASRTDESAELLTLLGIAKIKGGDEVSGLNNLKEAVNTSPEDADIRSELAKAYVTIGEPDKAIELLESALKKGDLSGQAAADLIMIYLQSSEFDKAIEMAKQLAEQVPDSPLPAHMEGLAYKGKNNRSAARNSFRKALEIKPDFILSILSLASLDAVEGDTVSARQRYEKVLELQPDQADALTSLAYLLDKEGKVSEAIELLEKARKSDDSAIYPRLALSSYYLRSGKAKVALTYAKEVEKISPKLPRGLLALIKAQLASGSPDAEATINTLIDVAPSLPEAHYYLALVRATARDATGARKSLNKTLELAPGHVKARQALGNLELTTGNLDAAMQIAHKLKTTQAGEAAGYLLEGDILMSQQKASKAITAYLEASERESDNSEVVVRINRAHRALGQPAAGYSALNNWLKKNPNDHSTRFVLAASQLADGLQDEAMTEYERILKKQPDHPVVLNDLAWLYYLKGKPEALDMARKANRLAPDNPAIQDTYGWLLVKAGRAESALVVLEAAASKLSSNREVSYHFAVALVETGQKGRAKQVLEKILEDNLPFQGREDANKLLMQL